MSVFVSPPRTSLDKDRHTQQPTCSTGTTTSPTYSSDILIWSSMAMNWTIFLFRWCWYLLISQNRDFPIQPCFISGNKPPQHNQARYVTRYLPQCLQLEDGVRSILHRHSPWRVISVIWKSVKSAKDQKMFEPNPEISFDKEKDDFCPLILTDFREKKMIFRFQWSQLIFRLRLSSAPRSWTWVSTKLAMLLGEPDDWNSWELSWLHDTMDVMDVLFGCMKCIEISSV